MISSTATLWRAGLLADRVRPPRPALSEEEQRFILAHKWRKVGLILSSDDYTDAEALAAIARSSSHELNSTA